MRTLLKGLKLFLLALLALVLIAGAAGAVLVHRPFPKVEGTLRVPGLDAQVQIKRDEAGIPHVYAHTDHDLFFAQGYVQAQDRLWQLEFNRRIAPGRLSEILGDAALENDRYLRALGMGRAAAAEAGRLDAESRAALEAYAAGVNAYLAEGRPLPIEFTILGVRPEPWTPADSIGWGKVIAWDLANNRDQELFRVELIARLGEDRAAELTPAYPDNAPLIVAREVDYRTLSTRLLPVDRTIGGWLAPSGLGLGSNNWVVSGARSTTGRPILANDPHLAITMPSTWHEIGLHCVELGDGCRYEAVGVSFPGTPAVVIGHNSWIAWGMTAPLADVQDWYIEKVNPANPHQVEYEGRWEDVQVLREEIGVKGRSEPEIMEVRVTRHGPIMSDVMDGATQVLALRWSALDYSPLFPAVLAVDRARNWQEFRDALRQWTIAGQNFIYADVEGNIGYQLSGDIPIRAKGNGLLPVPGWTGEYEWTGAIPFDELPTALNPADGYFLSANNRPVGEKYPYHLGSDWDNGYRARRIRELITAKPVLSPEDIEAMHADTLSIPPREITPYLLAAPVSGDARALVDRLAGWDYRCGWDSVACTIFQDTLAFVLRAVYGDELGDGDEPGDELLAAYMEDEWAIPLLVEALPAPTAALFDDVTTAGRVETRDDILALALTQAAADLEERLGADPDKWRWGQVHAAKFEHVLGAVPPLHLIFNRTIPAGGSSETVNCAWFSLAHPFDIQDFAASYRQIVSLANWSDSRTMNAGGQSGLLFHRHYDDLIASWRDVRYHPMLWTVAEVERHTQDTLILEP